MPPVDEGARLAKLRAQYESEKAAAETTGAIDAELLHAIVAGLRDLRGRLGTMEQEVGPASASRIDDLAARLGAVEAQVNRARVVDVLPIDGPLGVLLRVRGDLTGALYLGNGATKPLTKLLPIAL